MTPEKIDEAAKALANWFGYSWDGLREEGRVSDRGFKPWYFGTRGLGFQGTQEDVRDMVREIAGIINQQTQEKSE